MLVLTSKQRREIRHERERMPARQVAAKFGLSTSIVNRAIAQTPDGGGPHRHGGMTEDDRDLVRQDARTMRSNADVARKWGISRERVRQILLENPSEEKRALERQLLGCAAEVEPATPDPLNLEIAAA